MPSSLEPGAGSAMSGGRERTCLQSAAIIPPSPSADRAARVLLRANPFTVEFFLMLFALKTCQEGAAGRAKCTSGEVPGLNVVLGSISKQGSSAVDSDPGFVGSDAERGSGQAPARAIPTKSARLWAAFPSGLISMGMNKQMKQMGLTRYCRSAQGLASMSREEKRAFASTALGQPLVQL